MKAIFVSVRTGSTRLPKKALIDIQGKKTIEHLIDRVKHSRYAEKIILCTTALSEDNILCTVAKNNGINYFRGSSPDKLKRWAGAAQKYNVDFFVNVDGDDIFFDSGLADLCFEQYDSSLNKLEFIDGHGLYNDVYGIKVSALNKVCEFKRDTDTEFIRPYFVEAGKFNTQKIQNVPEKYQKKNVRMTLDYEEDLLFFKTIIEYFMKNEKEMEFEEILKFIKENSLANLNWHRELDWKKNQKKMIELQKNPKKQIF